jgi:hypothetical protein
MVTPPVYDHYPILLILDAFALIQLHEAIVGYDQHVSSMVISILQGITEVTPYPHMDDLNHLFQQAEIKQEENKRLLEQYRKYRQRLDDMHRLAMNAAAEG